MREHWNERTERRRGKSAGEREALTGRDGHCRRKQRQCPHRLPPGRLRRAVDRRGRGLRLQQEAGERVLSASSCVCASARVYLCCRGPCWPGFIGEATGNVMYKGAQGSLDRTHGGLQRSTQSSSSSSQVLKIEHDGVGTAVPVNTTRSWTATTCCFLSIADGPSIGFGISALVLSTIYSSSTARQTLIDN